MVSKTGFVSRVGSGILVDIIGFDPTAAIVTGLQGLVVRLTFVYLVFCECTLKSQASVHWADVTIIEGPERNKNDNHGGHHLVFTEAGSPSESLMGKTVSIDVPIPVTSSTPASVRKAQAGSSRTRDSRVPVGSTHGSASSRRLSYEGLRKT